MLKASAWFVGLTPSERKGLLALLHEGRGELTGKNASDARALAFDNLATLINQLENDHEDKKRVEGMERRGRASTAPPPTPILLTPPANDLDEP